MLWLAVYVGLALTVSFLCSLLEATLLSLTPTYLVSLESKRPKLAALWVSFKSDIDKHSCIWCQYRRHQPSRL